MPEVSQVRTLVTGGAGFIGTHLCQRLLSENHEVVVLDNLYTGKRENLARLMPHPRCTFVHHDVVKPLDSLGGRFQRIYNLACPASPVHYQKDPVFTLNTSYLGTLHVLERARRDDARVVHASTSEVYGDPEIHPQPESYWGHVNPLGPRACYDEGKRVAETLCFAFRSSDGVDVRLARIFNTYGPGMAIDDGRVVSNFIVQALRGLPLTVYGDGGQTRSFCYVSDLVDGLVRLMEHDNEDGPINLGNPTEHTVLQLAHLICELIGGKSSVVESPLPVDDPKRRQPQIDRARERLGFEPRVSLSDGLVKTIADFRARLAQ